MHTTTTTTIRGTLIGVVLAISAVAGLAAPADAAPRQTFTVVGSNGTSTAAGDGDVDVEVWLATTKKATPASATFRVRADDGTFPGPESCEPATAHVDLVGTRTTTMTLVATGRVCGSFTEDPTGPVTETFTGRYVVADGTNRFAGDDGFLQVIVGATGWSYLLATDT